MPDLEISVEKGWNVTLGNWRGIMAPAGTPQPIVDKLRAVFAEAKEDPRYKKVEAETYLDLRPGYLDSEDFRASIEKEVEIYRSALKRGGHI